MSAITWILYPSTWVFAHCNYFSQRPPRNEEENLLAAHLLQIWKDEQEGPYLIMNPPCSSVPQTIPLLHFWLSTDPHLDIVHDGNSLGFLEFITTLIHSKNTGKHETIERAFQLSPWICHQMWNIMGKLSRGETYLPNWQNMQNNTSSCLTGSQVSPCTVHSHWLKARYSKPVRSVLSLAKSKIKQTKILFSVFI